MGTHRHQAELLAEKRFPTFVTWDVTDTNRPVFKIGNMELPGCIALGVTLEAAIQALHTVRVAAVERLLDQGLPVPYSREMVGGSTAYLEHMVVIEPARSLTVSTESAS